MKLTDTDKKYLLSIGYDEKNFDQIEAAMNQSAIALFKEGDIDHCKMIDYETAREFLGNETLLSCVARSAFHFSSSIAIPHTFGKYNISIDSGEMLGGKKSIFFEKDGGEFDLIQIQNFVESPCIRVYNIEWDTDNEEYCDDLELPDEMVIPFEHIVKYEVDLDFVSDYISEENEFCHYGFDIEFNYTAEELSTMIKKIDKELEEAYKDGETDWTSHLECIKEEAESMIYLIEECEKDLDK